MTEPPNKSLEQKRHWPETALFVVLLAAPILLCIRPLAQGGIPNFMDTVMYFFPLRVHAAHLLAGAEWPLWNRCIMAGVPLLENPQAALAYPLHWPSLAWPGGFWFTFPLVFQLGLFAALTMWALRRAGLTAGVAFWAGVIVLAGGYGWSRLQYGNYLNVLPWWPLWLGAGYGFARSRRAGWLALGTLAVALQILAGAHQLAAYGLAGLGLFAFAQVLTHAGARGRWFTYSLLTAAVGGLLAAPGWLPQMGFIGETSRAGGLDPTQVLTGAIGSWSELVRALAGDWRSLGWRPSGVWADAESSASVGLTVLVLAGIIPPKGTLLRLWAGLWLGILVSIVLSLRIVMEPLVSHLPQAAGLFHDPRRWLGLTQWLLAMAAATGLSSMLNSGGPFPESLKSRLMHILPALGILAALLTPLFTDNRVATVLGAGVVLLIVATALAPMKPWLRMAQAGSLAAAVALLAHATWVTTDLATIKASDLTPAKLLITQADLQPGERFFTLDWQRAASYDYRRPDLAQWALPNLAMLWGVEDLGGYEPAQSRRYRDFVQRLHASEPWRQPYAQHFGLIQNPRADTAFGEANIKAALMPRWGLPLFLRKQHDGLWAAPFPMPFEEDFMVRALYRSESENPPIQMLVHEGENVWRYGLDNPHAPNATDDLVDEGFAGAIDRAEPPGQGAFMMAGAIIPPQFGESVACQVQTLPSVQLIDFFAWNEDLSKRWRPERIGMIAALMRYEGPSSWWSISGGEGSLEAHTIKANRIELNFKVTSVNPGREKAMLTIHDAWWPGWQAWIDGRKAEVIPDGLWRAVALEAGRHKVVMRYRPRSIILSLGLAALGLSLLAILLIALALIRPKATVPRGLEPGQDSIEDRWGGLLDLPAPPSQEPPQE